MESHDPASRRTHLAGGGASGSDLRRVHASHCFDGEHSGCPLLPFAHRAALGVVSAGATVALAPEAHAGAESEAASRIAWGLRPNGSVGFGNAGIAERVGLDGECRLSKNVGMGAQFAFQALKTLSIWPSESGILVSENRVSLSERRQAWSQRVVVGASAVRCAKPPLERRRHSCDEPPKPVVPGIGIDAGMPDL
jgi:hypothetical protein